jgi:putative endonuclease
MGGALSPVAAGVKDAWHVYIIECADTTLYTGIARDLGQRIRQHNGEVAGGPRYTRGRRPVRLLWSDTAPDRGAASRREAAIKKLDRAAKLALIGDRDRGQV